MVAISGNDILLEMFDNTRRLIVGEFDATAGKEKELEVLNDAWINLDVKADAILDIYSASKMVNLGGENTVTIASDMMSVTTAAAIDLSSLSAGDYISLFTVNSSINNNQISLTGNVVIEPTGNDNFYYLRITDTASFYQFPIYGVTPPVRNYVGFQIAALGSSTVGSGGVDGFYIFDIIDSKTAIANYYFDDGFKLSYEDLIKRYPGFATGGTLKLYPNEWRGHLAEVAAVDNTTKKIDFVNQYPGKTGSAVSLPTTQIRRFPKLSGTPKEVVVDEVESSLVVKTKANIEGLTTGLYLTSIRSGGASLIGASTGDSIQQNLTLVDATAKDSKNDEGLRFRPSVANASTKSFSYSGTSLAKGWDNRNERTKDCSGRGNSVNMLLSNVDYSQRNEIPGFTANSLTISDPVVDVMSKDFKDANKHQMRVLCPQSGNISVTISGSGVITDKSALNTFFDKFYGQIPDYYIFDVPGIVTFRGLFIITSLDHGGDNDGIATYNFTMESFSEIEMIRIDSSNRLLKFFGKESFQEFKFQEFRTNETTPFRTLEGEFMISQMEFSGDNNELANINFQLESAGQVTIT